jgi:hypothetical protein
VSLVVNTTTALTPDSALVVSVNTVTPRAPADSESDNTYPLLTAADACGITVKNVLAIAAAVTSAIFLNEFIFLLFLFILD